MPSPFGRAAVPIVGCIAVLIAIILLILSFASPYWHYDDRTGFHYGLWRYGQCVPQGCWKHNSNHHVDSWQRGARAMESLAIIFLALPLVVVPIYMYVTHGIYYKTMCLISTVLCFVAAICIIIGAIIYAAFTFGLHGDLSVGWCFVTCLISGFFAIVAAIIFLGAAIAKRPLKPTYYTSTVIMDPGTPTTIYAVEKDHSGFDNVGFVN